MLRCTPIAPTDQNSCPPPSLGGHRPAGQHASMLRLEMLACWGAPQQHRQTSILAPLPRWLAIHQHASMPACQHASMPARYSWCCWYAEVHPSSTDRSAFLPPPPSLGGHLSPQTTVSFSKAPDFEKLALFDYATYAIFFWILMRSWVTVLFDHQQGMRFFCVVRIGSWGFWRRSQKADSRKELEKHRP